MAPMLSELQLSLIGAGVVAVAGVWGYNTWQEYRQRKLAQRIFSAQQEDVLMDGDGAAEPGAEPEAVPTLTSAPSPERIEPKIGGFDEPVPAADEVDAASDEIGDSSEEIGATSEEADLPTDDPELAPETSDSEPPVELADDFIDCVVRLEASEMVAAPLLWAAQRQMLGTLGERLRWSGLDENSGQWRQLRAHDAASYRHLRAALQVADRNGPVSEAELARYYDGVRQLADNFQVAAEFPAASVMLAHARALDEFCASVDWRIGINVVNLAGQTMAAVRLIDLATETSLWLKDDGLFHAEDGSGQTVFTLGDLGGKPFAAAGLGSLSLKGVTLSVDVPRVADGAQAFDRLLELARRLMTVFDGTLVDDRSTPLSDEVLATIRAKIVEFQEKMAARQIPAGGRRALRLYS